LHRVWTVGICLRTALNDLTPCGHDFQKNPGHLVTFAQVKKSARDHNGFYLHLRDAIEDLAIEQIADNIAPARFFHVQVVNLPASLSDGSKDILIDPRLLDSTVILRGGPDVQHWKQIVRRK